jgi:hypothetical protein
LHRFAEVHMSAATSLRTPLLRVLVATCALLLLPAVAMQFTRQVQWGAGDFLAAGALLFLTGGAMVVASRAARSMPQRVGSVGLLALAALLVWAELAVGVFH